MKELNCKCKGNNEYFRVTLPSGNNAKERISKRVFQENEARQIFRKSEHFFPPDTYTSGGKKCSFYGKFCLPCFLETHVLRFALLANYQRLNKHNLIHILQFQTYKTVTDHFMGYIHLN